MRIHAQTTDDFDSARERNARVYRMRTLLLAVALCSSSAAAQRPDFSGTWMRVASAPQGRGVAATGDAAFRKGHMGSGWGSPPTIAQTPTKLHVEFEFFTSYDLQPRLKYDFRFDAIESVNAVNVGNAPVTIHTIARWEGGTLFLISKYATPPGVDAKPDKPDLAQILMIDEQTGRLVIEAQRRGASGAMTTVTTTYTKR